MTEDPMSEGHWRRCLCGKPETECPKDGKPACARNPEEVARDAREKQAAYEYLRQRKREGAKP